MAVQIYCGLLWSGLTRLPYLNETANNTVTVYACVNNITQNLMIAGFYFETNLSCNVYD